jgi:hypothetical protein
MSSGEGRTPACRKPTILDARERAESQPQGTGR